MKRSFYSLRHGQTAWNALHKLQGHTNIPLNDTGRAEASASIVHLAGLGITRVFCSDLDRARETAEIVAAALGVPVTIDARLREIGYGKIEGMTPEEVKAIPPEREHEFFTGIKKTDGYRLAHGGETNEQVSERVWQAMVEAHEKYPNDVILFVWHGGVHRRVMDKLTGKNERTGNATPYFFEYANNTWAIQRLGLRPS